MSYDFFQVNGLDRGGEKFEFPRVEKQHFMVDWLPCDVLDYIGELETALALCENVIERLNTDRMEAHRRLRMQDYLRGMGAPSAG